jgi:hypothetical protein
MAWSNQRAIQWSLNHHQADVSASSRRTLWFAAVEVCEPNTTYERKLYAPIDDAPVSQPVLS